MVIAAFTVDIDGNESPDGDAPIREDWIYGAPGDVFQGGIQFSINGTLAIGSDQAPHVFVAQTTTAAAVRFVVKTAPVGAGLTFNLNLGGAFWMTLTILAGTTSIVATSAQIAAAVQITANTTVTIDLTAVGTTSPGGYLSGAIFF